MRKFKWLVALGSFLVTVQPCFAADRAQLVGARQLVSSEREFQESGQRIHVFGKNPAGSLVFTPRGANDADHNG